MERSLTLDSDVPGTSMDKHLNEDSANTFFSCLTKEASSPLKDASRLSCQISSVEMERSHIRRSSCDDIISKELPKNILDTDFDDKCDDTSSLENENDLLSIRKCGNILKNDQSPSVSDIEGQKPAAFENMLHSESSSCTNDSSHILASEQNNTDKNSRVVYSELLDGVTNEVNGSSSAEKLPESNNDEQHSNDRVTDSVVATETTPASSSLPSTIIDNSEFIPTIVDIRGACPAITAALPTTAAELPPISIIDIKGNCNYANAPCTKYDKSADDLLMLNESLGNHVATCPSTGKMKDVLNCTEIVSNVRTNLTSPDTTTFTSEIFINDVGVQNQNDDEVIVLETSSKVPSPIPIKVETQGNASSMAVDESKIIDDLASLSNRSQPAKEVETPSGYTCHLCNTTFQQHNSLNDHMTLHRRNLVGVNSQTRSKSNKPTCPVCSRQLTSWQALQQHLTIHNTEKTYECATCHKIFRHLSNYKLHMQKHEVEKRALEKLKIRETMARQLRSTVSKSYGVHRQTGSSIRGASLRKELEMSRSMSNRNVSSSSSSSSAAASKHIASFDTSTTARSKNNSKENVHLFQRTSLTKSKLVAATAAVDDDVIPMKTFKNVENIVMNAARFIVKVDNIDPNILKRRIKTPDISIDKDSSICHRSVEKRKISLPIPDRNKRLKLDQIENIIMDDMPSESDHTLDAANDDDEDYDYDNCEDGATMGTDDKGSEQMTDDELFRILSDSPDRNRSQGGHHSFNTCGVGKNDNVRGASGFKFDMSSRLAKVDTAIPSRLSNVIMLRAKETDKNRITNAVEDGGDDHSETVHTDESDDDNEDARKNDPYDKAFQRVAQRRLLLIQKRAARNGGKIDSKYLLGPLFWRKALRRVRLNPFDFDVNNFTRSEPDVPDAVFDDYNSKVDDRRTNDPVKLQARAENKLHCIVGKLRKMDDLNVINLAGPKFWQKTLKLAGIHKPNNLRMLLTKELISLRDVEFVSDDEIKKSKVQRKDSGSKCDNVEDRSRKSSSNNNNNNKLLIDLTDDSENKVSASVKSEKFIGPASKSSSPSRDNKKPEIANSGSTKSANVNSSILYESLTNLENYLIKSSITTKTNVGKVKPLKSSSSSSSSAIINAKTNVYQSHTTTGNSSNFRKNSTNSKIECVKNSISAAGDKRTANKVQNSTDSSFGVPNSSNIPPLKTQSIPPLPVVTDQALSDTVETNIQNSNIILNVDGEQLQLITTTGDDKADLLQDGSNYILVSDETGTMRLVKESDLQIVDNGKDGTQYILNMATDNVGEVQFLSEEGGGEQVTYALQFDGQNYTAVQFVQDDAEIGDGKAPNTKQVVAADTNYVIQNSTADLNSIDRELSDFLNLDYR